MVILNRDPGRGRPYPTFTLPALPTLPTLPTFPTLLTSTPAGGWPGVGRGTTGPGPCGGGFAGDPGRGGGGRTGGLGGGRTGGLGGGRRGTSQTACPRLSHLPL